jgi:hypothetical protein
MLIIHTISILLTLSHLFSITTYASQNLEEVKCYTEAWPCPPRSCDLALNRLANYIRQPPPIVHWPLVLSDFDCEVRVLPLQKYIASQPIAGGDVDWRKIYWAADEMDDVCFRPTRMERPLPSCASFGVMYTNVQLLEVRSFSPTGHEVFVVVLGFPESR